MFRFLATVALADALNLRTTMQKKMKMCVKARMESMMCKSGQPEVSAAVQVLKGVRDACSHCRDFQCSPGLCYAGPCPQGVIDPNVNPDCLSSDYCWNPAPVSVKGSRYRLCFAKASEGGHGLSIQGGKVVADASSGFPRPSAPGVSASLVTTKSTVTSASHEKADSTPTAAPSMAPAPSMAHYAQQVSTYPSQQATQTAATQQTSNYLPQGRQNYGYESAQPASQYPAQQMQASGYPAAQNQYQNTAQYGYGQYR